MRSRFTSRVIFQWTWGIFPTEMNTMSNTDNMTMAQMAARIKELEAKGNRSLTCKISEKKALSVYGLGRFPVTLYKSQWNKLIAFIREVEAFIELHEDELAEKD
jgi:hypothetical protein